ncbi:inactive rhomboid protein 1 isoform X2 [Chelonus insularis]|uniref:inactive rhomboid protein 1 isoform X2 n=1 Tax=Chelonus insularis TaxID=460826 RepID=UPI00158D6951|nr:inactive rhomboid protein 1 isoform X2 [Chelonus insularis]
MPTDDDYGRRERLLLHQHSTSQFGTSTTSSTVSGTNNGISSSQSVPTSAGSGINSSSTTDCYLKQQLSQPESRAPSSTSVSQELYQKTVCGNSNGNNERIESNESTDYGARITMDKYEKQVEKQQQSLDDSTTYSDQSRSITSCCERFNVPQNHEKFNQPTLCTEGNQSNHQYSRQQQPVSQNGIMPYFRYTETNSNTTDQRLSIQSTDRFQRIDRFQSDSALAAMPKSSVVGEYANSGILALSTSKPFSPETFPSPPSPAPTNDRFVPPPPLSPSSSDKYASTHSLVGYPSADRILPPGSPNIRNRYGTAPASPIPKNRFASTEKLLASTNTSSSSTTHDAKDQQQRYAVSTERLLANGSPILGGLQRDSVSLFQVSGSTNEFNRYTLSSEKLLTSSPIHAPVPERFASKNGDRFITDSPTHDRYHRHESSSIHHDRLSTITTCDKYLSNTSNLETTHQPYNTSDRILGSSSATDAITSRRFSTTEQCQKYSDRGDRCSSSSSPAPTEYSCRYSTFQDISGQSRYTIDRFNDLTLQRLSQSRINDRFSDRYLVNSSPTHDGRTTSESTNRFVNTCSTERLLVSSSPSSSENSRFHSLFTTSGQTNSDRFIQQSPTSDSNNTNHRYQSQTSTKSDKFIQVAKSVSSYDRYQLTNQDQYERTNQERVYGFERYGNLVANNSDRYQGNEQRFHGNSEIYSPARGVEDKYLSLPKPKDSYPTGRIVSSCSSVTSGNEGRNYPSSSGTSSYVPPNAHTPVERYVPQPPPEVLYPERYVDRYVPPPAHTPTDRYVPTAESSDPYMRRDLGFHHHYRLPPPGYPYHQSHFRFRGFTYAPPSRLGGSPGSSSSSSSTSMQREFTTSPLLRPKVRASAIEFTSTGIPNQSCCSDAIGGQRNCCQVRRSLPPGALSSISSNQSSHSSWQQSPSSGTTGTSTISSSGGDGENAPSIGMYAVGNSSNVEHSDIPTSIVPTISPSVPSATTTSTIGVSGSAITRSVSAPATSRPGVQVNTSISTSASTGQRPKLKRNISRTETIRNYIKKETAKFFGVDEETEAAEKQRWLDRRRRFASRMYGELNPDHKPLDPDITKDVPDASESAESVTLRRWQQPVRRKDSVVRMTLSGLHYMVDRLTRQRSRERSESRPESRSFPPSVISISQTETSDVENFGQSDNTVEEEEEEVFFQKPTPLPSPPASSATSTLQQSQISSDQVAIARAKDDEITSSSVDPNEKSASTLDRANIIEELPGFIPQKEERLVTDGVQQHIRRPNSSIKDHYTSRTSWRRSRYDVRPSDEVTPFGQKQEENIILRREITGRTRISPNTIDRVFDNSNRRQYGMGIIGRFFGSFRRNIAHKPHIRKQLDDIEDHRPFFTYWITIVQILVMIISLACYGFGPVGIDVNHRSGLVLVTSLSLQQVDYQEPANFWIGPRAADLIHLGAKFAPCMRRDMKILKEIDVWRERERDTACCIRNDDSGCVQSSKADCSNTISTWKKWGPSDSGPGGRISGSVCGLDPKFCDAPASIAPYEWPDDITKWPICRKTNPFSQRFRSNNGRPSGNNNFPVGRYKDKMAEHMVCEVIGHPCCIGIHGMCRITTKEYCDFVHGYFHEEASLCSQVECLHDVCGMIPFLHPEWPDQFYRLFTTTFLHAGILHLAITLLVQYYLMRDLEKITGSLRIALIYFTGALAGNLASAIFIPYRAEVGPAGAHFALLATLVVEVLNCWPMLKHPRRALTKLILILTGFLILGVLPWVDNYAHFFGFIFGFLASYALMPFISFGQYDHRRKILLIWICLFLILGLFALLLTLFYNIPVYECEICKLFNCIPFTRDFCASQNINFKREEPV